MLSVLFDLDDTLINNNTDRFTRVYMELLGKYLQPYIDSNVMLPYLLEGTNQMIKKSSVAQTLEETFDRFFYPGIGISKEQLTPALTDFYNRVFTELKSETSPVPGAADLVRVCLSRGWNVAIATNPLFPLAAVYHRVRWAGLDPENDGFAALTAYETYHFAKPQPAYFTEVTYRIQSLECPTVMIGNDLKFDIYPAVKAGMPAYWLTSSDASLPSDLPSDCACGPVEGILPWLEKIEKMPPNPRPVTSSAMLAFLRGGAAAIDAIAREFSEQKWNTRPADTEWCLTEILCHLRDVDSEINLVRINTVLKETQPFIAGIESDHWSVDRDYLHQNGRSALSDFLSSRQMLIELLESVSSEDWERVIRHSIFGPTSLKELVGFIVSHDNNHIKQIKNLKI